MVMHESTDGTNSKQIARLYLDPDEITVAANESRTIKIMLDTEGEAVDGVDVLLQYDLGKLTPSGPIDTSNSVFSVVPYSKIDAHSGVITISATTEPGEQYAGVGEIATLQFTVRGSGEAQVDFQATDGSTTDTNVVQGSHDILLSADGAVFNIDGQE